MNFSKIVLTILVAMAGMPIVAQQDETNSMMSVKKVGKIAVHVVEMAAPILIPFMAHSKEDVFWAVTLEELVETSVGDLFNDLNENKKAVTRKLCLWTMAVASFTHGFLGLKKELKPVVVHLSKKWKKRKVAQVA